MSARRKSGLDQRLEPYFATLRSSALRETLKRRAGNWHLYAAVTGSAMAMATSTSAAILGSSTRDTRVDPIASILAASDRAAAFRNLPVADAIRLAMAQQVPRQPSFQPAAVQNHPAAQSEAPYIMPDGIVPLDGTKNTIQAGELVTIYGRNLASGTFNWKGNFPTSLGGTKVEIDNKPAYLIYVSPTQINLQSPDDKSLGTVSVVVTTAHGSAKSYVTLSKYAPALTLLDVPPGGSRFVAGIIHRPAGTGAFGKGKD